MWLGQRFLRRKTMKSDNKRSISKTGKTAVKKVVKAKAKVVVPKAAVKKPVTPVAKVKVVVVKTKPVAEAKAAPIKIAKVVEKTWAAKIQSAAKKFTQAVEKVQEVKQEVKKALAPKSKELAKKLEPLVEKAKTMAVKAQPTVEKIKKQAVKAELAVEKEVKILAATAAPTVKKARAAVGKKILNIPAILLEDDAAPSPNVSGPGQRYSLGPTPPSGHFSSTDSAALPEAYGTKKLMLIARDPHWLYAHWDLTSAQLKEYNAQSKHGHLVLRLFNNKMGENLLSETHVHPESRHWFVHVGHGGSQFVAELGIYGRNDRWIQISVSAAAVTPPDSLSDDTTSSFATIPVDMPFETLLELVKTAIRENVPLAEAVLQLRATGFKNLPMQQDLVAEKWTPQQQAALAKIVTMDSVRRIWIGSLEITEVLQRQLVNDLSSVANAQFSAPSSPGAAFSSLSSPFGGSVEKNKSFWFNVNAELIIYGATEPDAKVTIGGRKIRLRSDGTFSYRFILPDGDYNLPAEAVSADGEDSRCADLSFKRGTDYRGDVGAHPQDAALKAPHADNVD